MGIQQLLKRDQQLKLFAEKKTKIAYWLSIFGYSTRSLLLLYLQKKDKSAFRSVLKGGFLIVSDTDMLSEKLVLLGKTGHVFAREIFDFAPKNNLRPSNINHSLIRHEISLQKYLISRIDEIENIRTARQLDYADKRKLPDAIIRLKNNDSAQLEAVEIERVHKSNMRIFQAFYNHAYAIAKLKYYDKVTYVFPSKTLMENYLEKFDKQEWPVYRFNAKSRRYQETDEPFVCSEPLKQRFEFTVMDMD